MKKRCTIKSILILNLLLLCFTGKAQEINLERALISKLSIKSGIPFFQDSSSFESVYDQLTQLESNFVHEDPKVLEENCGAATPVLKSFEGYREYHEKISENSEQIVNYVN